MKNFNKNWNLTANQFSAHVESKDNNQIDPAVADNIVVAYPVILKMLKKNNRGNVLDYGCGTGGLTDYLNQNNIYTSGYDPAEKMIELARKHLPIIKFYSIYKSGFNILISSMVFHFIEHFDTELDFILSKNTLDRIIFSVFRLEFIEHNIDNNCFLKKGSTYLVNFDASTFPIYPRSVKDYDIIFNKFGYERISLEEPEFPDTFADRNPTFKIDVPEFMIFEYIRK